MKNKWFAPAALVAALVLLVGCLTLIYTVRNSVSKNVAEVTVNNFEDQVLKSPMPVYIQFYVKKNCKACQAEVPIVEKLAVEYAGKVRFVRVEARENMELAIAAGVQGVPTHFFLKPAEGVGAMTEGFLDEAALRKFLDDGLALTKPAAPVPPVVPVDPKDTPVDPKATPVKPADETTPATPVKPVEEVTPANPKSDQPVKE